MRKGMKNEKCEGAVTRRGRRTLSTRYGHVDQQFETHMTLTEVQSLQITTTQRGVRGVRGFSEIETKYLYPTQLASG
jgi:hypothetical protein